MYLTDAVFHDVALTNARFKLVDLTGVTIRGAAVVNVEISGEVRYSEAWDILERPLAAARRSTRPPG